MPKAQAPSSEHRVGGGGGGVTLTTATQHSEVCFPSYKQDLQQPSQAQSTYGVSDQLGSYSESLFVHSFKWYILPIAHH